MSQYIKVRVGLTCSVLEDRQPRAKDFSTLRPSEYKKAEEVLGTSLEHRVISFLFFFFYVL